MRNVDVKVSAWSVTREMQERLELIAKTYGEMRALGTSEAWDRARTLRAIEGAPLDEPKLETAYQSLKFLEWELVAQSERIKARLGNLWPLKQFLEREIAMEAQRVAVGYPAWEA